MARRLQRGVDVGEVPVCGLVSKTGMNEFREYTQSASASALSEDTERNTPQRKQFLATILRTNWFGLILLVGVFIYGAVLIKYTTYAVRGPDSTGYANLAYSLQHGTIAQPVPLLKEFDLPPEYAPAFLLRTYLLLPGTTKMAPFYPVGLPLHMMLFSMALGWQWGLYLVSPIFAVLSVALFYCLCLELGLTRNYASAAATIFALCPTLLYQALQVASDVPATFWTLVTISAALRSRKNEQWSLLAGAAFGVAFLVRPTSILLLLPLAFCLRLNWRSLVFFGLGGLPCALVFFAYNYVVFEHPLRTGYSLLGLEQELSLSGVQKRFAHYVYWVSRAMSPLLLLSWLATPMLRSLSWRVRLLLLSWFGAFFGFYCCYSWYDAWWYTRFLLPAIPALVLALMFTCRNGAEWLAGKITAPFVHTKLAFGVVLITLVGVLSVEQQFLRQYKVFDIGRQDMLDRIACRRAKQLLPERALIFAMEMNGTWRFYTDRDTVRWDLVPSEQLQEIMRRARAKGLPLYAFLMAHEVNDARKNIQNEWTKIDESGPFSVWRIEMPN